MHSYYILIYLHLNASVGERMAAGLMMISRQEGRIRFSERKIEWMCQILPEGAQELFKSFRLTLTRLLASYRNPDGFALEDFFSRLETFRTNLHNLVSFSEPIPIFLPNEEAPFEELFRSEVESNLRPPNADSDSDSDLMLKAKWSPRRLQSFLKAHTEGRLQFNYLLTAETVPAEDFPAVPVSVPFAGIGKDDLWVTGHYADFTSAKNPGEVLPRIRLVRQELVENRKAQAKHLFITPVPEARHPHYELYSRLKEKEYLLFFEPDRIADVSRWICDRELHPPLT